MTPSEKSGFTVEYTITDLFERMERMESKLEEKFDKLNENFDHTINGNGKEGLRSWAARMNQIVDGIRTELVLHRWVVGVILVLIGGIILKVV